MIIPAILAQDNTASEIVIYKADDEYIYQGCYTETNDINGTEKRRALPDANKVAKGELVVPDCLDFCEEGGYPWAGVQFSRECWCGHFLSAFSEKVDDRQCNTTVRFMPTRKFCLIYLDLIYLFISVMEMFLWLVVDRNGFQYVL